MVSFITTYRGPRVAGSCCAEISSRWSSGCLATRSCNTSLDNRRIMAAESLGGFLYGYKSYSKIRPQNNEVIWVHKRYDPQDLRSNAPVQRSKFLCDTAEVDGTVPEHWRRETQPALKTFSRHLEEEKWYSSSPATRCEEWSTLRQILPSKGVPSRTACPRWGTGAAKVSEFKFRNKKHFPHINSPMTR